VRVAVVGAGPSGSAVAIALARAGADVTLFERDVWPRAKACGDGITPSSVAELASLGLAPPGRTPFATTFVSAPSGAAFRAPWPVGVPDGTTMPRRAFDAWLVDAAIAAGAAFHPETTVTSCTPEGSVATRTRAGAVDTRDYDIVMLAEGATGGLASECGLPPHTARLAAYRGYVETDHDLEPAYQVHYAKRLVPGYAWIFPVDARLANVGACVVRRENVRAHLYDWIATDAFARADLGERARLADGKGGVIPIGRARRTAGRVFALGDAAGVADPLSAEGISQAIGTARLATAALLAADGDGRSAAIAYERAVRAYDVNNREAFRMRGLFAWFADPMIAIARKRERFARFVVASGYFQKRDASWFWKTFLNV
jgi:geranylgeranyl reductase family protein